jgi:hypothetical protein
LIICPKCGYVVDGFKPSGQRGRALGSTNWSRERFWKQYVRAAKHLKRPYRKTHLAALMGLTYGTFIKYLDLWGAPQGEAAPGD